MPLAPTPLPISTSLLITNPLTANLNSANPEKSGDHPSATTSTLPTTTLASTTSTQAELAHVVPTGASTHVQVTLDKTAHITTTTTPTSEHKVPVTSGGESVNVDTRSENEKDRTEPMKSDQQEQEVRDFLTKLQKNQKGEGFEQDSEGERKRQRT
jgi:hypothetical protein